jgi:hypothetical protein
MNKLIEYKAKFDSYGNPFFINMETGESWHIGHKVIHNARPVAHNIHSFYIEYHVKPEHDGRTFVNVQALLVGIDGEKMGYAHLNTLKSLESPYVTYATQTKQKSNYFYIL